MRLTVYLSAQKKLSPEQIANCQKFVKMNLIPEDMRLTIVQDLIELKNASVKKIMADPTLALMVLNV